MNEKRIDLPSGGAAFVMDVVPHSAATALRRHHLRIGRYMGPARDLDGNQVQDWRNDLTSEELDAKDELILQTEPTYIRALTLRWEGVTDAEGHSLTFPEDVERMQEPDLMLLAVTLMAGRRDPKSAPPSESSSEPESSPPTPISAKT